MWISKRKWQQVNKKIEEIEKSIAEQEKRMNMKLFDVTKKSSENQKSYPRIWIQLKILIISLTNLLIIDEIINIGCDVVVV